MTPADQMREAAAKVCILLSETSEHLSWGGNEATALEDAAAAIRALPMPPEPPLAAMEAALRDFSLPNAQARNDAALAVIEAWKAAR